MKHALRVTRKAVFLFAVFAAAVWSRPVTAQAQSQDRQQEIQQLKDKLQQMDQMMGEVKAQINALETAEKPSPAPSQTPAKAQKAPEQPEPLIAVPSEAIIRPQIDPVPLEGEITEQKNSINFYGFAMLDSGYDFGQIDPAWFDVIRTTKLPSFANQFAPSGNVYASVRQTRFGVKTSTPTHLGDLNTVFEWELYGTGVDAGQTTLRLRHAYGELGPIGAGQTWSPFMDIGVFPNTVEYWGPSGMAFFRNVQIRWMPVRKKSGSVAIALEIPDAAGDQGGSSDRS